jgi:methionyl-tRNA formyltransferase
MGTGPFAAPTFQALLASQHQVLALVTRPAKPQHRREKSPPNPMLEVATQQQLDVFAPESINSADSQTWLRQRNADLFVVCDYGQILSHEALGLARFGGINLHASLLPKYRGAAPINWAIYHGEIETGVTVIHMTAKLDAGPALVQLRTPIEPEETAPQLESRLSMLGVGAVLKTIEMLIQHPDGSGIVQNSELATTAPRLKKEDGLVDWSRSAVQIANQVRAFQPWPKTYTLWNREAGEPLRLILEKVHPASIDDLQTRGVPTSPGTIVESHAEHLLVATGAGLLQIDAIQPAGKRVLTAAEFLRGYPVPQGTRWG